MKKLFATVALLALTAGISAAQQFGVIDAQKAVQSYWKYQADTKTLTDEQSHLNDLRQQYQDKLRTLQDEINAAQQDAQNPGLSAERKEAAQKEADEKTQEAINYDQTFQAQYQRFQVHSQQLQYTTEKDFSAAVKTVAVRNNLDMVFMISSAPYGKIDVTDEVIAELNSTMPAASATGVTPAAQ